MSHYGIQLKKLQLEGANKENATIEFDSGLNVIAGASDTGKSFAFECINYILGASDIPTLPPEASGYTDVLLELLDKSSNQIITLKRSLSKGKESKVYFIYSEINKILDAQFETLSVSSRAAKNLSTKLLELCGCSYKNVLKNSSTGETETFTFRKFVPLIMLNETRIVQNNSPIYLGNTKRDKNSTKEVASFFTLLTGFDYQKYLKTDSPEIKRAFLKGAIEELMIMCTNLQKEIPNTNSDNEINQLQEVNYVINDIETSLKSMRKNTEILELQHQKEISELNDAIQNKRRMQDNLAKFKLLKKNYLSDINRLDFIEQVHDYTNQLADIKCPICHAEMNSLAIYNQDYYVAIQKEKEKLNLLLADLQSTINDMESEVENANKKVEELKENISIFESKLENQSKEISLILIKYEQYLKTRDELLTIETNRRKLFETQQRIQELNDRLDNTKNTSEKVSLKKPPEELLEKFCFIINDLLNDWGFIPENNCSVTFSEKNKDVIVCKKEKSAYGKGARAIINTAFIIAIMEYCYSHNLSHPGFVVLDSPLTTYKERDKQNKSQNEDISNSIKTQFFYRLSRISKNQQIIIFDNKTPPEDLFGVKFHHFTGNKEIARMGFIPEST